MVHGMMAVIGWWDLSLHQTVKQIVASFKFSYNLDNKFQRKMQLIDHDRQQLATMNGCHVKVF